MKLLLLVSVFITFTSAFPANTFSSTNPFSELARIQELRNSLKLALSFSGSSKRQESDCDKAIEEYAKTDCPFPFPIRDNEKRQEDEGINFEIDPKDVCESSVCRPLYDALQVCKNEYPLEFQVVDLICSKKGNEYCWNTFSNSVELLLQAGGIPKVTSSQLKPICESQCLDDVLKTFHILSKLGDDEDERDDEDVDPFTIFSGVLCFKYEDEYCLPVLGEGSPEDLFDCDEEGDLQCIQKSLDALCKPGCLRSLIGLFANFGGNFGQLGEMMSYGCAKNDGRYCLITMNEALAKAGDKTEDCDNSVFQALAKSCNSPNAKQEKCIDLMESILDEAECCAGTFLRANDLVALKAAQNCFKDDLEGCKPEGSSFIRKELEISLDYEFVTNQEDEVKATLQKDIAVAAKVHHSLVEIENIEKASSKKRAAGNTIVTFKIQGATNEETAQIAATLDAAIEGKTITFDATAAHYKEITGDEISISIEKVTDLSEEGAASYATVSLFLLSLGAFFTF